MKIKIIISGGGTGGHIFPAIAIANALRKLHPDSEILFIGAKGKMETKKVPDAGYPIKGLWISGWQRRQILANIWFPLKLLVSMIKARQIIRQFKPQIVIGTGGYASGPALKAAIQARVPVVIQEQNSFPGITNRILANKATEIYTAYEGMEKFFPADKIKLCGNPVRSEISRSKVTKEEARMFFDLQNDLPVILVVGGSQGAKSINEALVEMLPQLKNEKVQLIWQTGKTFYSKALFEVQEIQYEQVRVRDFIKNMNMAYAAADLVISRAGALAIAELCLAGKPVIFVPFPAAAGDHQTANAKALETRNAAVVIADKNVKDLMSAVETILHNSEKATSLSKAIKAMAINDADMCIAHNILQIVKNDKA
ncbi:MAG: undecaprenyldiphospho-muramoylpentapeptide beta-N-acetylglucosaminyltransferase [Bacteroidales bacterium]|nr:undecaprenyldiphospho-muramoylpentapeptide beta-N-acetylglucosaminyltransferase [Bacteroidales bacterium]